MNNPAKKEHPVAIVTGASTGIGFAITQRLLADGYRVVMNARTADDLNAAEQRLDQRDSTRHYTGDVSDKATGQKLVQIATQAFGGVDLLVNNAGVFAAKPFLETEEADIDRFFAINFKGAYFTSQAALPSLLQSGRGAIINVGTVLVEHAIAGFPASAAVASKAALHSLTEHLAAEFGTQNVRVSTISTGIVDTPLHAKHGIDNPEGLAGLHLLNRIGRPEDVADAVAMLAGNAFITGTTLRVDGGHAAGHSFA